MLCLQIAFEAQRGFSASCDTALDNIVIAEGACPCKPTHTHTRTHHCTTTNCCIIDCPNVFFTACVSGCDFDTIGELCGWTSQSENDIFGFEQWNGPTGTEGTGPDDDFSKPGCKGFLFSKVCMEMTVTESVRMVHYI